MADDEDPNLGYKITGDADIGPINEVKGATEGLKGTLGETAGELRHLTGSAREGQEIFRGLGAAAEGGARGIGEMIRGLRSLALVATHVMGEGPLGILLIGLGLIGGAFLAMRGHAEGSAEGIDKAGKAAEEAAKKMEAIKKQVDESFKPLDEEVKRINERFAELEKRIDAAGAAAKRLDKATTDVQDSAAELARAKEIDAAGGDETKIAYINRKYDADKKVAEAQRELNEVGNEGLELQTKKAAADDKARQLAEEAQQANNKAAAAQDSLNKATVEGSRVIGAFDEKEKAAGHLTDADRKARSDAFQRINEARGVLDETQKDANKANDAYAKATAAADEAALAVEREQLVTQKELLTATNKLATALIEQKDADKAKVDTSEPAADRAEDKDEAASAKGAAKAEADKDRADKKEEAQAMRADAHEAAAAEREHRHVANVQLELARRASKETADHLKSVNEAMGQLHHAAREAGKSAEKITRQVTNMTLDTSQ